LENGVLKTGSSLRSNGLRQNEQERNGCNVKVGQKRVKKITKRGDSIYSLRI